MKQESRKQEIIRIAAKLFKEKGYSAVTMRDLAKAMGIKAASLYNHIDSKEDILNSIIISLAEEFTEGLKVIQSRDNSCVEKLKSIINLHVSISSDNIFGMASLNNDWMHLQTQKSHYLKLRKDYEDDFLEIIEEGMRAAEIKKANPEIIMFSMLTTLRSLYLWIPKKEDLNANELSHSLSQVLIYGVTV